MPTNQQIESAVSAAIRAEMASQRVTQAEIAERSGLKVDNLRRKLANRRSWSLPELSAICSALGRPLSSVLAPIEASGIASSDSMKGVER